VQRPKVRACASVGLDENGFADRIFEDEFEDEMNSSSGGCRVNMIHQNIMMNQSIVCSALFTVLVFPS
jgi:hypothetical protein